MKFCVMVDMGPKQVFSPLGIVPKYEISIANIWKMVSCSVTSQMGRNIGFNVVFVTCIINNCPLMRGRHSSMGIVDCTYMVVG